MKKKNRIKKSQNNFKALEFLTLEEVKPEEELQIAPHPVWSMSG